MASLTHTTVYELHERILSGIDGVDLSEYTTEIVQIFGGIDKIVSDYLTTQQLISSINKNKLQKIDEILSNVKRFEYKSAEISKNVIRSQIDNHEGIAPLLLLDEKDTWLHSLFSQSTSDKLHLLISHKISIATMSTLGTLVFVLRIAFPAILTLYIYITLICFCFIPFMSVVVLSANCVVAKLVMTSFEFWLKTSYVVIFFASVLMLNVVMSYDGTQIKQLEVIANAVTLPYFLLVIACIFNLDAYNMNKLIIKIAMPTIFAVIFFVLWIQVTLLMYSNDKKDPSVITISNDIRISLNSQIQGASFILSIFCFKQTFMTFRTWHANCPQSKSISIRIAPRIKWELYGSKSSGIQIKHIDVNLENSHVTDTSQLQEIEMHKSTQVKKKYEQDSSLSIELYI